MTDSSDNAVYDQKPFEFYEDHFRTRFSSVPWYDDLVKLLEWVSDKPGIEMGLGDMTDVIGKKEVDGPTLAIFVALGSSAQPIASPFYKVRSKDGELYSVNDIDKEQRDGEKPYTLEATGEVFEDVSKHAYIYLNFEDFIPKNEPSGPKPGA